MAAETNWPDTFNKYLEALEKASKPISPHPLVQMLKPKGEVKFKGYTPLKKVGV